MSHKNIEDMIPGGAHTYSRGNDQFPQNAPGILANGKGAFVWDLNGAKYLDFGMALRSVSIGYSNRSVDRAALKGAKAGNNLTRPSIFEYQAAEKVIDSISAIEMVKFAKNGSNVVTAALKLARAFTGKKYVAIAAEHPFFSFDDWFIGSTEMSRGAPPEFSQFTIKFRFNDAASLKQLFVEYPGQIAAVLMEPATSLQTPGVVHSEDCNNLSDSCLCEENFLQYAKRLATSHGALLVLDEMITGFRWELPGAHKTYDVTPDLLTFGKAIANGYSVAFLGGRADVMEIAGIRKPGEERVFLLSSTHGAEMSSLAAMTQTMGIQFDKNIPQYLIEFGNTLKRNFNEACQGLGLADRISLEGYPSSPTLVFKDSEKKSDPVLRTLFMQEMVNAGVLMPWVALSQSHGDRELRLLLNGLEKSAKVLQLAIKNNPLDYLLGQPAKPVFRKFN